MSIKAGELQFSGEYVVMPAHNSGAATSSSTPSGIRTKKSSSTTTCVVVAAAGDRAVAVDGAVGLGVAAQAVLLVALLADLALAARVDHAPDADAIAERVLRDLLADRRDDAGNLVARDVRVGDRSPLAAAAMDVGVTDVAERDVDQDVGGADLAAFDLQRDERLAWRMVRRRCVGAHVPLHMVLAMAAPATPSTATPTTRPVNTSLLVPVLVFVTLVAAVVSSLGAPLIPLISTELNVPLSNAQWSLTVALLAGAVCSPILGRLGDGAHRREVIAGGLAVVVVGGVIVALAGSLSVLVMGRALQGVGLGLLPMAMAAARDALPTRRLPPVIGLLSVSAAAGVGVGYPVSGLIAEHFSVQAAFWFGAGFSAIAMITVIAVVPKSTGRRMPLDRTGAVLVSGGLIALLLAIGQGANWGWGSLGIVGLLVVAAVLLAAWVPQQLGAASPLVELRLLRYRSVFTADVCAFVLGAALYMILSVVTAFVQAPSSSGYGFGASASTAGLCLVPFSVTSLLASRMLPTATRLLGPRGVLPFGCTAVAGAAVFFALTHDALWEAFASMALLGVGLGLTFAVIPGMIVHAVPAEETGSALGFYQVARYVGFSIGSGLVAAILASHTLTGTRLPTVDGFLTALWVVVAVCVAAAAMAWVMPGGDGTPSPATEPRGEEVGRLAIEEADAAAAGIIGPTQPSLRDPERPSG